MLDLTSADEPNERLLDVGTPVLEQMPATSLKLLAYFFGSLFRSYANVADYQMAEFSLELLRLLSNLSHTNDILLTEDFNFLMAIFIFSFSFLGKYLLSGNRAQQCRTCEGIYPISNQNEPVSL